MAEQFVSKASEFKDGERRIVFVGDREIGVFKEHGQYYAYSNVCLHQGGPACEGLIIAKVEEKIMPDMTSGGLTFSTTERHFVCPWHGYEYDIATGRHQGNPRLMLRPVKIVVVDGDLVVTMPAGMRQRITRSRPAPDHESGAP